MTFDDILHAHVGKFGRFQILCLLLMMLPGFQIALNIMEIVFMLQIPEHACKITDFDGISSTASMSISEKLHFISPLIEGVDGALVRDECRVYDANFTEEMLNFTMSPMEQKNSSVGLLKCEEWDYDETFTGHTMVLEWDLVCDRTWWKGLIKSVQLLGQLFGVIIGGTCSDRFGRRTVGRVSLLVTIAARVIMSFVPKFEVYLASRMVNGACDLLLYSTFYMVCCELLHPSKRALISISVGTGYVIGGILIPLVCWLLPNWKHITLANTILGSLPCLALFLLPESPRWQYCVGKNDEAKKTLEWMAKVNRRKIPSDIVTSFDIPREINTTARCSIFAKSFLLQFRLALVTYIWFTVAMIYFGLYLNIGSLAGNIYINTFIMGMTDIPGCCFISFIVDSPLGRRFTMLISLLICSATLLTDLALPRNSMGRTVLSIIGKMFVTIGFSDLYVWVPEIFPTSMRATTLGTASAVARIGSFLSPFITLGPGVLPTVIFGTAATLAGICTIGLPETRGKPLPATVQDMKTQKTLCPCLEKSSPIDMEPQII